MNDILDHFKEHYFFEISRKHQLTNSLSIPIGVLVVLGGAISFFIHQIDYSSEPVIFLFYLLIAVSLFFFLRTMYFLVRSYHNFKYRYIPSSDEALSYYNELKGYYSKHSITPDNSTSDFEDFLIERYSKCANDNTWSNDSKTAFLHKANNSLITTLICVAICSIPYFYLSINNREKIQKIEIVNSQPIKKEIQMTSEKPNQTPPKDPKPQQKPVPPPKPVPPQDRIIVEGVQPPKKK